ISNEKTYEFTFRVYENDQLLATGTHHRAAVDIEGFLKKVSEKES
ncbi:dihydrolipoamide acyltransferase, partial [Escherichia coli]